MSNNPSQADKYLVNPSPSSHTKSLTEGSTIEAHSGNGCDMNLSISESGWRTGSTTVPTSRFLALPQELRDRIYRFVHNTKFVRLPSITDDLLYGYWRPCYPILLLSRSVSEEVYTFAQPFYAKKPLIIIQRFGRNYWINDKRCMLASIITTLKLGRAYDLLHLAKLTGGKRSPAILDIYTKRLPFPQLLRSMKYNYHNEKVDEPRLQTFYEQSILHFRHNQNIDVQFEIDEQGYQCLEKNRSKTGSTREFVLEMAKRCYYCSKISDLNLCIYVVFTKKEIMDSVVDEKESILNTGQTVFWRLKQEYE
ncbi:hypothetical protein P280DRAFT_551101 [Massarina eburnea CBS 473.64]|uniref:Uncharacterized protein n=1 Tax=Massarina eburnea CBS 473.64 TaxID=1395130 RepID=A0A6A6RX85_9PLEO|nr:hypothetical protein P280DRAFT_551101 [Massarina eburnea CBS 473.64]